MIESIDIEFSCVFVKFKEFGVYITCSYIPPHSGTELYTKHSEVISKIFLRLKENDRIVITGDFNIPNVSWNSCHDDPVRFYPSSSENVFLNSLFSLGLSQVNFILNSNSRILDLIFVDDCDKILVSRTDPIVHLEDSYHPTLKFLLNFSIADNNFNNNELLPVLVFDFKNTDVTKLNSLLSNVNWESLFCQNISATAEGLDNMTFLFNQTLLNCFELTVPKRIKSNISGPIWFTNNIRKLRNTKTKYYKKYIESKKQIDFANYTSARYVYQIASKNAYLSYLAKVQLHLKLNAKSFWSFVNTKRKSSEFPSFMKINDIESDDESTICNMFADFFKSTYSNETYLNNSYPIKIQPGSIRFPMIDSEIVLFHLNKLKVSFSAGPDNIPSFILKYCAGELVEPITQLFELSLSIGHFPTSWKESFIIPLHKSGNKSSILNYRGIAKMSVLPKLFEQIITTQMAFNVNMLISPRQHGFLPGRSTSTNLLEFSTYIFKNFSHGSQTDVIYTDFSKAFDVVNHKLILIKLELYGFPPSLVKWISSYLNDRTQQVLFKSSKSYKLKVNSGVPQGSHLGPILFLLFINDLSLVINHCNILMFADDVKIFRSVKTLHDASIIQSELVSLNYWCNLNCMRLNLMKCKQMTFFRCKPIHYIYKIENQELEKVETFKDLGVLMDSKFRFDNHTAKITSKSYSLLGFIKRWAKEFNDPYITKLLFTSLVRPTLEYASVVWCPNYNKYIGSIESIQKQFLLFCLRDLPWNNDINLPSYESRLKLINLPPLKYRRILFNAIFIFKLVMGLIDSSFLLSKLSINIPRRPTRNYRFLYLSLCKSNYQQFQPFRNACQDFNLVYDVINFNDSVDLIKSKILTYLYSL